MTKISSRLAVHPVVFGAFPVLFVYAQNCRYFRWQDMVTPLALSLALVLVAWLACGLLYRDIRRGGLWASLCAFVVFGYGHAVMLLDALRLRMVIGGVILGPNKLLLPLSVAALFFGATVIKRRFEDVAIATSVLNYVAACLLAPTMVMLAVNLVASAAHRASRDSIEALQARSDAPHIVLIVLDAYTSSDMLKRVFDYDNSWFLTELQSMGFCVSPGAKSNYGRTVQSLGSILNLRYLEEADGFTEVVADERPARRLLRENMVFRKLADVGYHTVRIQGGSDIRVGAQTVISRAGVASEFAFQFLQTTIWHGVESFRSRRLIRHVDVFLDWHVKNIDFVLDELPEVVKEKAPTMVLAHVICPHPPFVYGVSNSLFDSALHDPMADGAYFLRKVGPPEAYRRAYRAQVDALSRRVIGVLRAMKRTSSRPLVCILQGDHGSGLGLDYDSVVRTDCQERLSILFAYSSPEGDCDMFKPDHVAVNTFRILFNKYFSTQFPLLKPKFFLSEDNTLNRLIDVTDRMYESGGGIQRENGVRAD